jgi:phage gpG-like protein
VNVKVKIDKTKLDALLQSAPERLHEGVRSGLEEFLQDVQRTVVGEKLSGQVLHVRTGALRRSIQYAIEETGRGFLGKIGSNLVYAAIHEYGGIISARLRPLKFKTDRGWVTIPIGGWVVMPERSYLRTSLQEELPDFPDTMKKRIVAALEANA